MPMTLWPAMLVSSAATGCFLPWPACRFAGYPCWPWRWATWESWRWAGPGPPTRPAERRSPASSGRQRRCVAGPPPAGIAVGRLAPSPVSLDLSASANALPALPDTTRHRLLDLAGLYVRFVLPGLRQLDGPLPATIYGDRLCLALGQAPRTVEAVDLRLHLDSRDVAHPGNSGADSRGRGGGSLRHGPGCPARETGGAGPDPGVARPRPANAAAGRSSPGRDPMPAVHTR